MSREGIIRNHLAVLVTLAAFAASPALSAADASSQDAKATAEPATAPEAAPSASEPAAQTPESEPKPEADAASPESKPEGSAAPTVEVTSSEAEAPAKKPVEPVTGAFGMVLGTHFEAAMVEKVLSEEPRGYRVADGSERKGTLYRVVPKAPDEKFTDYSVATTEDGTIYRIRGEFSDPDRASKCAATKVIAAKLQAKYGKPRGQGSFGEWYAFRDLTAAGYRGIRVDAVRCKRGIYSINYEDETLTRGPLPEREKAKGEPVKITIPRRSPEPPQMHAIPELRSPSEPKAVPTPTDPN